MTGDFEEFHLESHPNDTSCQDNLANIDSSTAATMALSLNEQIEIEEQQHEFEDQPQRQHNLQQSSSGGGCSSLVTGFQGMNRYEIEFDKSSGSFGDVVCARDRVTKEWVAIKIIRRKSSLFPKEHLRECYLLRELKHPNIVRMIDLHVDSENIFIIMEFLSETLSSHRLNYHDQYPGEVQVYLRQILAGLAYCHNLKVIHRDIKPTNLLVDVNSKPNVVKLADFGWARGFLTPELSPEKVTRGYRAPEILLGSTSYTCAIDIWSVGCVFAEMASEDPFFMLFEGDSDCGELDLIFSLFGTPNEEIWPGVTSFAGFSNIRSHSPQNLEEKFPSMDSLALDLLKKMLTLDPAKRITASDALKHAYLAILP